MRAANAGRRLRITAALLVVAVAACSRSSTAASPSSSSPRSSASPSSTEATTTTTSRPARDPSLVAVWGDSLALQAAQELRAQGRAHGLLVTSRAFSGLAPCDVVADLRRGIETLPDAVVIAFSGNNLTECMKRQGSRLTGDAYYAAYRRDVGDLVSAAAARNIPVVVVGAPAFPPSGNIPDRVELNTVLREVADSYPGARYVASAPFLSPDGFTRTLPCGDGETAALGCDGARITVRGVNGIHFDEPHFVPCPSDRDVCSFSAGGHHYAKAILAGLSEVKGLSYRPASSTVGVPVVRTRVG